jgi:hypothetical protein
VASSSKTKSPAGRGSYKVNMWVLERQAMSVITTTY